MCDVMIDRGGMSARGIHMSTIRNGRSLTICSILSIAIVIICITTIRRTSVIIINNTSSVILNDDDVYLCVMYELF